MPDFEEKRIRVNWFSYWFSGIILKLTGWKTGEEMPNISKAVLIVAHHTSNWDFPVGMLLSYRLKIKSFWMGKHTLFTGWYGFIFRWLGGIPADRRSSQNLVELIVREFDKHPNFILVIAPEGTRKRVEKWKTGFYYIAKNAGVPILCAYIDYKRKVGGIGPVIYPGDDMERDMKIIRDFYAGVTAKNPDNVSGVIIEPK